MLSFRYCSCFRFVCGLIVIFVSWFVCVVNFRVVCFLVVGCSVFFSGVFDLSFCFGVVMCCFFFNIFVCFVYVRLLVGYVGF